MYTKKRGRHGNLPRALPGNARAVVPNMVKLKKSDVIDYLWVTVGAVLVAAGVYFFKFPNNFTFGGVSGFCVVLTKLLPFTPGQLNMVLNLLLLVVGYIAMGRRFAVKTAWATVVISVLTERLEVWCPMTGPMTDQPLLELIFAILLPAAGAAVLFQREASGGGTDIIAVIIKDRTGMEIGKGLFVSDIAITASAMLVFDVETVLFSCLGLLTKTLVVDGLIQNMNLTKCFIVVCDDAEPICRFINEELKRGATITQGVGAFSHQPKQLIFSALKPGQAHHLRNFIHENQPTAFMMISSSSEIVGKGFMKH